MTRRVYKYALGDGTTGAYVELPQDAKLVLFEQQGGVFFAWFEVDPDARVVTTRTFIVVGTGHDIPDGFEHRWSFQVEQHGGQYVWHLYEWAA